MEVIHSMDWRTLFLFSIIFLIDIYDESFKKTLTNYISLNSSEILKQAIKIFFILRFNTSNFYNFKYFFNKIV